MALNFLLYIKGRRPFNEIHVIADRALIVAAPELLRSYVVFRFEGGNLVVDSQMHIILLYIFHISYPPCSLFQNVSKIATFRER